MCCAVLRRERVGLGCAALKGGSGDINTPALACSCPVPTSCPLPSHYRLPAGAGLWSAWTRSRPRGGTTTPHSSACSSRLSPCRTAATTGGQSPGQCLAHFLTTWQPLLSCLPVTPTANPHFPTHQLPMSMPRPLPCPALPCPALPSLLPACRLNMYIESDSYASNLKQKLVCGSVLVALRMEYFEWYARGLEAGKHYVELTNEEDHVCEQVGRWGGTQVLGGLLILRGLRPRLPPCCPANTPLLPPTLQTVAAARDMNAMLDSRGRSQLDGSDELTPTLTKQLAAMRADRRLAKLLKPPGSGGGDSGAVKEPAPGAGGNFTWGSALMPWEIAANGQQFVQDHVRMQDALLYIR